VPKLWWELRGNERGLIATVGAYLFLDAVEVESPFEFGSAVVADVVLFVFLFFFCFWKLAAGNRIHTVVLRRDGL